MNEVLSLRVVLDTNIVFAGLTQKGGAAGLIIALWLADLLNVYVSNALAYEYVDVLSRKLSTRRWATIQPILGELLSRADFLIAYFSWRPSSPDPGDAHVIDCAMNAGAIVVTSNVSDFALAKESLGLQVMDLVAFVNHLAEHFESE
jgi:putative PIN family toxin of toxin-antitoxin system